MQSLRGPAMKIGQMLSLQTGILPEETLAELATLQREAPGMHPSLVRVQVKGSLGREPEQIFKDFTPKPFAAASLGQVHHGITRRGQRVAVKVQYPGIRQAVENDFKLFRAVSKPAQASGHIPKSAIDEVERADSRGNRLSARSRQYRFLCRAIGAAFVRQGPACSS